MKKIYKLLLTCTAVLLLFAACKKFNNRLTDPNLPDPTTANVELYLNYIKIREA